MTRLSCSLSPPFFFFLLCPSFYSACIFFSLPDCSVWGCLKLHQPWFFLFLIPFLFSFCFLNKYWFRNHGWPHKESKPHQGLTITVSRHTFFSLSLQSTYAKFCRDPLLIDLPKPHLPFSENSAHLHLPSSHICKHLCLRGPCILWSANPTATAHQYLADGDCLPL